MILIINKYLKTNLIEKQDLRLSVQGKNINLKSNVHNLDQLIKTPRKTVIARSKKQSDYIKALTNSDITMALGPAGTGKSFIAVSVAMTMLIEKRVQKVILSRPAVEAGERLGFLPGDMREKVDPYLRPLYDSLYDLFDFLICSIIRFYTPQGESLLLKYMIETRGSTCFPTFGDDHG